MGRVRGGNDEEMTALPRERENNPLSAEAFEIELARKVDQYIREADAGEDERRRSDRIGGNLFAGRHWDTRVDPDRAALTVNYARSLILQLVSLQTKQDPVWVVSPNDAGDREAARAMQNVLPKVWERDEMARKLRNAMYLGEVTRTCAAKTVWDESLDGFVGNVTTDIIPGWRLILDAKTANPERMRYIGDRALMSRAEAMLLYPEAAEAISHSADQVRGSPMSSGGSESPVKDQFKRFVSTGSGQVAFSTGGACEWDSGRYGFYRPRPHGVGSPVRSGDRRALSP